MNSVHGKSLRTAYLIWLILGLFGGHRFYLGKWFSGFLYAISAGFYGIGWAIDLLLLPFMVRRVNERAMAREPLAPSWEARAAAEEPVELVPAPEPPAWAERASLLNAADLPLRLVFFAVTPCFFTISAAMLEQWELLVLMVATLAVCGFVGNVESLNRRYPAVEKVPMLNQAIGYLRTFTSLYREQAPFGFSYYLFYPITAPLALLVSPGARRESKVFGKLIGGFMLIVAARMGFSYFSVFPPHLGPGEAVLFFILQSIFILMLVVLFVLPTVTTALTLNAMRRTGQLRLLIGLALVSALPMGLAYQFAVKPPLSFISAQLLDERLGKESFRQELGQSASMFLAYWGNHLGELDKTPGDQVEVHQELTKKWQRLASGLVVKDEANAFRVLTWREPAGETWLGIGLWNSPSESMTQLLLAARAGGKVFTRWSELPAAVQQRFQVNKDSRRQPFEVLQQKLLDDIRSSGLGSPRPERAAPK